MKKSICGLLLLCSGMILANDAVFTASFEESFIADSKEGRIDAKVSQELLWETLQNLFQPGISGKAAVVGTAGEKKEKLYHAVYKKNSLLRTDQGTVSFFVKPLNWGGEDKDFHIFFQASGPDATLIIYKYVNSDNLMFLLGPSKPVDGKYLWGSAGGSIKKWQAGQWHHIAAAYDRELIELFIDGKRVSKVRRKALPEKGFTQFSAGALYPDKWKTPLGLTLIDELQIFDRKLSLNEVNELTLSGIKSDKAPEIRDVATIVNRDKKVLDLHFSVEGSIFAGSIELFRGQDRVFLKNPDKMQAQNLISIPLANLSSGDYLIAITGRDKSGKDICRKEIRFLLPETPESWKGNNLGVTSKVVSPWSELSVSQSDGKISGKTFSYDFSGNSLPLQITAGGKNLLSRPVEVLHDGKKLPLQGSMKMLRQSGDMTVFEIDSENADFYISSAVETHFDGFVWVKMKISPKRSVAVKRLQLVFPFKLETSTLFNSMNKFYMSYIPGHCGKFDNYSMNLYTRPPVIFVGNEHCGLQWFCEKLPHWYNKDKDKTLQLETGKNENYLLLNFVDTPITIDHTLEYEFGFQSVPMRPMPENWRSWSPYRNFDPYFVWSRYHHYPYADAVRSDEKYRELFETKKSRFGNRLFYYFAGFTITPTFPEWPYYSSEWMLTPPELGLYGCIDKPASYFTWICPASAEYRDFYLDRLKNIIETLDIPNIYIDNSDAQMCDNPRHGCGYVGTDGRRYSSFNLRGTRILAQRVYTMFKEMRPAGRLIRHMSAKPVAPVVSFADMLVDGELYNKTVADDESYFNIFSPEMFRASFCGTLWGAPQFFIPQFTRVIPVYNPKRYPAWKTPEARLQQMDKIRHFTGYFLVHDAQIFQLFGVNINAVEALKAKFGLRDQSSFIGYFEKSVPWKCDPGVMVSGYIDNGKLMLVIMNESNSDKVDISLDTAALAELGVEDLDLTNAENGQRAVVDNGRISAILNRHDYMLLWNISQ